MAFSFRTMLTRVVEFCWELFVMSWLTFYYIGESTLLTLTPAFLTPRKSVQGQVVLITGGAGGLGQQLALRLAKSKAIVVVWDINETGKYTITHTILPHVFKYIVKFVWGAYLQIKFRTYINFRHQYILILQTGIYYILMKRKSNITLNLSSHVN